MGGFFEATLLVASFGSDSGLAIGFLRPMPDGRHALISVVGAPVENTRHLCLVSWNGAHYVRARASAAALAAIDAQRRSA